MRVELNEKPALDKKKVWSFVIDAIFVFMVVSLMNLAVVKIFNLSPTGLLKQGIETALYDLKMTSYDWISVGYVLVIISYLAYLRKTYSLGDILLANNK